MPQPTAESGEPGRAFLITAYVVVFLGGAILGLFGALLLPYSAGSAVGTTVPTGGTDAAGAAHAAAHVVAAGGGSVTQVFSVGLLFALLANPLLSWAGMRMTGTRLAAFLPLGGWLIVVLPLASGRASGSVVLPSGARSLLYLLIGTLTFIAVGAIAKPTRGMSVLMGQPLNSTPAPPPKPAPAPPARIAAAKRKSGSSRTGSKGGKRR